MYRRFFCFAVFFLTLLLGGSIDAFGQVLLPDAPVFVRPPIPNEDDYARELKVRKKAQKEKAEAEFSPSPQQELPGNSLRDDALDAQAHATRPYLFMMETKLLLPSVKTTGQRKNYTVDPSTENALALRLLPSQPIDGVNMWLGIRAAYLSGSGFHGDYAGRYAFTFVGPLFMISYLTSSQEAPPDRDLARENRERIVASKFPSKSGLLLQLGVAAVSKQSRNTLEIHDSGSDFSTTRGTKKSGSGFWMNLEYLKLYFGAVGVHAGMNLQTSSGVNFYGIYGGVSGWY